MSQSNPSPITFLPTYPLRVRLFELLLEHVLHVKELAADVDVGDLRADRVARNQAALEEQMRVALHQQVILERAGLALVGVADDVFRLRRVLDDELPLHAGREIRRRRGPSGPTP